MLIKWCRAMTSQSEFPGKQAIVSTITKNSNNNDNNNNKNLGIPSIQKLSHYQRSATKYKESEKKRTALKKQ